MRPITLLPAALLLIATVGIFLAACGSPSAAEKKIDQGSEAMDAGLFKEALALFGLAVELEPDSPAAWTNRAAALANLGRLEEAIADATRAIELEPQDVNLLSRAFTIRSFAHANLDRLEESLDDATKAIEIHPKDIDLLARAYINRAFVLGELGRVEEALADDDTAIALKPPDILVLASAYANRAVHLRDLGEAQNPRHPGISPASWASPAASPNQPKPPVHSRYLRRQTPPNRTPSAWITWPGAEALATTALAYCTVGFETYVDRPYDVSRLNIGWIYPTQSSWDTLNQRTIVCVLYDAGFQALTGSMLGVHE